ncbi:hypothetical protein PspLS_00925 [Pyricularia sp. CBS 133598]|nr:hypothetical protein PspLS_00925 [Pyricularia sp. CBS 133598]
MTTNSSQTEGVATHEFFNIINGQRRGAGAGGVDRVIDPRTEEPLWEVPIGSAEDLEDAVTAARAALPGWTATKPEERQKLLAKMAETLGANMEFLVGVVMKETGKSQLMGTIEIGNTIEQCKYFANNTLHDKVQFEDDTIKIIETHAPLGVVGAISPWNFPLILSSIKVISALVMGNTVIMKPSPFTPYCVLKFAELCQGFLPPGVLQAINGGGELGGLMTLHEGIDKISFTGSIPTGKKVMANCAKTLKRVTLELGGNDAALVCADVDVDKVAAQTCAGSFFNAGQFCAATKRIYVHADIYDAFVDKFVTETKANYESAFAGDGVSVPTIFGPVSNKMQFDVVKRILDDAASPEAGGKILTGGKPHDKGYWIQPTVVAGPREDSMIVKDEQFGPVIPILKWSDEQDVIKRANLSNSGLGATVYSKDLTQAERIARQLESGSVWINMSEKPNPAAWFGGWKDSGFGGEMGLLGLYSYCHIKSIHFAK